LMGRRTESRTEVVSVAQGSNLSESSERFELDPSHLVKSEAEAHAQNLELVGIWHSHPNQAAIPSEADRAQAWGGWSYLIASVSDEGETELRSWRLEGEVFREEAVSTEPGTNPSPSTGNSPLGRAVPRGR